MDGDSDDDDMPVLASFAPSAAAGAAAEPATATAAAAAAAEEEDEQQKNIKSLAVQEDLAERSGCSEAELALGDEHTHPAGRGVLMPERALDQSKVHPGAVEPIVRNAKTASALKEQGNQFFKVNQLRRAEECYSDALRAAPLTPDHDYSRAVFYGNRAACYLKMTLYDKCVEDCTEAIALSSNYVKVIMRRAKALELKEDLEGALVDLKRCLEIDPNYREARLEALRVEKAVTDKQEKMKEEVIGKLKTLGNTILGKFGLSLDNFKMKQNPDDGTYSMSFEK
jgi:tetratricopeptide (TPR) repeat protein